MTNSLYAKAVIKWGVASQEGMFIEEIGEVLTAWNKKDRNHNGCTHNDFLEELVDLDIMLEQMRLIHDTNDDWDEIKRIKLKALNVLLI